MATVKVYDQNKQESGQVTLAPEIFEVEVKPEILHLVTRAQMAARRAGTHAAKTRAFVSVGCSKPWKHKGTGRARSGSNRSPVWRGGAIIFGPQPRSYDFKVNRKVRALALKMALSSRLVADSLMVLNGIDLPEAKTKLFAQVAKTLGLTKALFVLDTESEAISRSARNIPGMKVMTSEQLNVLDVLSHKQLVLLEGALGKIEGRFAAKGDA